jgi:hypothetical protein
MNADKVTEICVYLRSSVVNKFFLCSAAVLAPSFVGVALGWPRSGRPINRVLPRRQNEGTEATEEGRWRSARNTCIAGGPGWHVHADFPIAPESEPGSERPGHDG